MVAFHQANQRLAVGTAEGMIILFDLRTATKWRILEGHTGAVSAVAFAPEEEQRQVRTLSTAHGSSSSGILVSYSAKECAVRWWTSGSADKNSFFFSYPLLSMQDQQRSQVEVLEPLEIEESTQNKTVIADVIQHCRLRLLSEVEGMPSSSRKVQLELIREDQSQVILVRPVRTRSEVV